MFRAAIEKIVTILTSRKCWAFGMTTYLLCLGAITPEVYAVIALAFMGVQGSLDYRQLGQSFVQKVSAPSMSIPSAGRQPYDINNPAETDIP